MAGLRRRLNNNRASKNACHPTRLSPPRPRLAPLSARPPRRRRHHLRARADPDPGFRRRGGRLQPRQRHEGGSAGRARFDRSDGVEKRRHSDRQRAADVGAKLFQCAVQQYAGARTFNSPPAIRAPADRTSRSTPRPTCRPPSWPFSASRRITVTGSSTAKWGSVRLRVALVLDNTGSMADDGKIAALQDRDQKSARPSCRPPPPPMATSMCRSFPSPRTSMSAPPITTRRGRTGSTGRRWRRPIRCRAPASGPARPALTAVRTTALPASPDRPAPRRPPLCRRAAPIKATSARATASAATTARRRRRRRAAYSAPGRSARCYGRTNCTCSGSGYSKTCSQSTTTTTYLHDWFIDRTKWSGCITDRGSSSGPVSNYDRLVTAPTDQHSRDAVSGRAIQRLPAGHDGPELQLVGDDRAGQRHDAERLQPISRSGWSGAGSRWSAAARSPRPRWIRTTPTSR